MSLRTVWKRRIRSAPKLRSVSAIVEHWLITKFTVTGEDDVLEVEDSPPLPACQLAQQWANTCDGTSIEFDDWANDYFTVMNTERECAMCAQLLRRQCTRNDGGCSS